MAIRTCVQSTYDFVRQYILSLKDWDRPKEGQISDGYHGSERIERPILEFDLTLFEFGQQCLSQGRLPTELEIYGILGDFLTALNNLPIVPADVCTCGDFLRCRSIGRCAFSHSPIIPFVSPEVSQELQAVMCRYLSPDNQ